MFAGFIHCNVGKLEEAEDLKMCFRRLLFVRIEIDQLYLMFDLLSNISLMSVSYTKINHKRAREFIFSTTDLQTVNYNSINYFHCRPISYSIKCIVLFSERM